MINHNVYKFTCNAIKELTGYEVISPEDSIFELGLDSLDLVELIMSLEDEFNVRIPDEEVAQTVKDICNLVISCQKSILVC